MIDIPFPAPCLDVRDLRVVLAVATAGTTARAARLLHLTQPAVSRALLAAEERLGVALFTRSPRGLSLSATGAELASAASRLLVELTDLERRLRRPLPAPLKLRLVCECYTAYHWLPTALAELRRSLPDLVLELAVEHTTSPVAALVAGKIDIALLTSSDVPPQFEERRLFSDELLFVIAATHPLASRRALTRADLRAHTLLTATTRTSSWFVTRVFGRARPKLRYQVLPLTEAILDVARAGQGIAVLSEWIARPHLLRGDLVAKRLTSGPLARPWRIAYRREAADAAERLRAALERSAPSAQITRSYSARK
jgi:LysR family transcriptional regulator for metE and metH